MIVNKIMTYADSRGADEQRFSRVLFFAADIDKPCDSERYWRYVYDQSGMGLVDTPTFMLSAKSGNLSKTNAMQYFNDGYGIVISTGHGSPDAMYTESKEYFDIQVAKTVTNFPIYSFWYMLGCKNGAFDLSNDCLAEVLVYSPDGCIGTIAHSRTSWGKRPFGRWYPESGEHEYVWRFWNKIFIDEISNPGEALYKTKEDHALRSQYAEYLQEEWVRRDLFGVNLFGDPSINLTEIVVSKPTTIPTPSPTPTPTPTPTLTVTPTVAPPTTPTPEPSPTTAPEEAMFAQIPGGYLTIIGIIATIVIILASVIILRKK